MLSRCAHPFILSAVPDSASLPEPAVRLYVLLAPVYVGLGGDRNIPANLPRPH